MRLGSKWSGPGVAGERSARPGMFSAEKDLQHLFVFGHERIESTVRATMGVMLRRAQTADVLVSGGVLLQAGQPLAVRLNSRPHQRRPIRQAVRPLPAPSPQTPNSSLLSP
jgi:hypothetical protein